MKYCFLRFPGGKFKAVTLSYDDGNLSDLQLIDIINRYKIKGTFNINSSNVDKPGKLSSKHIEENIIQGGHEIAIHGERHIAPGVGRSELVIADILNCRRFLENSFDTIVRGMAYPDSGIMNLHNKNTIENIQSYIKSLGIAYARVWGNDNSEFMLPDNFLMWSPTAHHENPHLTEYIEKFLALEEKNFRTWARHPRLFFLWGHSSEFVANNNWNILEDFCERISYKEDTWYATNIEIYDYVKAYNDVIMNCDGTKIYNPTLTAVWLDVDGELHCVLPGEIKNI